MLAMEIVEGRGLGPGDTNALVMNGRLSDKGPQLAVGKEVTLNIGRQPLTFKIGWEGAEPFSPAVGYPACVLSRSAARKAWPAPPALPWAPPGRTGRH